MISTLEKNKSENMIVNCTERCGLQRGVQTKTLLKVDTHSSQTGSEAGQDNMTTCQQRVPREKEPPADVRTVEMFEHWPDNLVPWRTAANL